MLQGCYFLKQGSYLLRYTGRAVDNQELLLDSKTPESTRNFLRRVNDISDFALKELGLENNRNYSRYVKIDRDFLACVVSATKKYSFEPYCWSYPLVGDMPYKGFYEKDDALKEAARLEKRGYDVWVREVDAFSTLGYLTDPLYSYMENYSAYRIANLIIHEQAHATLFLKGQGDFNESFATFVGDTGAKHYIADRYGAGSREYTTIFAREADRETFLKELEKLKNRLHDLYLRQPADMEERKRAELEEFKEQMREHYDTLYRTNAYRGVPDLPINNAFLSLYSLYNNNIELFEEIYRLYDGNLRRCISAIKNAAQGSKNGYNEIRKLLDSKG